MAQLASKIKSPMLILRDQASARQVGIEDTMWRFKYIMNTQGKLAYLGTVWAHDMAEAKFKATNQLLERGA